MESVKKVKAEETHVKQMERLRINDDPGNKLVAEIWEDATGGIEILWTCDKDNCGCTGSWSEKR